MTSLCFASWIPLANFALVKCDFPVSVACRPGDFSSWQLNLHVGGIGVEFSHVNVDGHDLLGFWRGSLLVPLSSDFIVGVRTLVVYLGEAQNRSSPTSGTSGIDRVLLPNGAFLSHGGTPSERGMVFVNGKIPSFDSWMMTGGTPIWRNPHFRVHSGLKCIT